ncbi:aminotransferase class I/II-fold pyridoxal phosphate-dependent enzyme [Pedobacter sandarakinus]|uniref:aminotransferase class I/II-fold pyridoxal phosphate-dependent enzyme n=1 Tax=Pedobacter sandarakinus TaxID=353156 RepID=UPI002247F9F4|nr:aminotransferase class I/II-fold pyridoxal phosphate-dependent enzyme [Pedobacter sandarakinus]MCX2574029.1 aminotransferase class I/II-fold pyridoxal phosphate-dependent enzyme [Pedobacter sandarakinus]
MKAIILCAGYGNRMSPLTKNTHKTLLKIGHETIVDRLLNSLKNHNISKVVIVTGYLDGQLRAHIDENHKNLVIEYIHNDRYQETNNIFSLALAFENILIDDDILLIESDLIYNENVLNQAINSKHENVALVSPYKIGMDGTVVQISNQKIINIFPPHLHDENFNLFDKFKTLNIYKFSKDFCQKEFKKLLIHYARSVDDNCYYELILGIIIYMQRQDIFAEVIDNNDWFEVDDPNDLENAFYQFNTNERIKILNKNFGGYWHFDIIDFCFIRNMYFPSTSVMAELKNHMLNLLKNYGSKQETLNQKLSYVLQYSRENLIALNGASQIYPILKNIWKNKKGLIPEPTFSEYDKLFDKVDTYDPVGFTAEEIKPKIQIADVVVFVNPNNPTGSIIETNVIWEIANQYPDKTFIIDESFIEFSNEKSIADMLETDPKDNILVIRSMSKSYGLPGMRVGFAYANNRELLKTIADEIPIWNMNSMAEFFLEIILKDKISLNQSFEQTKIDRHTFIEDLKTIPYLSKVYDSHANFILFEIAKDNKGIEKLDDLLLKKYNIYIKNVSAKFKNDNYYFRVAVRLPHENELLVNAMKTLIPPIS